MVPIKYCRLSEQTVTIYVSCIKVNVKQLIQLRGPQINEVIENFMLLTRSTSGF